MSHTTPEGLRRVLVFESSVSVSLKGQKRAVSGVSARCFRWWITVSEGRRLISNLKPKGAKGARKNLNRAILDCTNLERTKFDRTNLKFEILKSELHESG